MIQRMFVLFGLAAFAGTLSAAPPFEGDAEAGAGKAAACAACHGPNGNSSNPEWPKLAGQHARYLAQQLQLFKSGKRQNAIMMGQVAGLSEQDMKDLGAYFAEQEAKPGVADESLVADGKALYFGGKPDAAVQVPSCSGCHGPAGLGNAAAGYPRISGQHAQYVATRLKAYREGNVADTPHARMMTGVAEGLTDKDIEALANFVMGLQPARAEGQ